MPQVTLTLGPITFADYEIPESMPFGGEQMLSKKTLIGGKRVIDIMGRDDAPISWSGQFRGATALFRARFLDDLKNRGIPVPLVYSQFYYLVVIKTFSCQFHATYEIPYRITVEILEDQANPVTILLPVSYNDAILGIMQESLDIANAISNPSISSALALLSETLNSIPDLTNADSATLATIQGPLQAANVAVSAYITATTAVAFV